MSLHATKCSVVTKQHRLQPCHRKDREPPQRTLPAHATMTGIYGLQWTTNQRIIIVSVFTATMNLERGCNESKSLKGHIRMHGVIWAHDTASTHISVVLQLCSYPADAVSTIGSGITPPKRAWPVAGAASPYSFRTLASFQPSFVAFPYFSSHLR